MSSIKDRNERVRKILDSLYERAINAGVEIDETAYKKSMDKLFSTTAWGFREILLVVIIGMRLDRAFKASTGLYDCNPRAIYEGPIKEFLIEKEIPHRKSGPLNVAKATVGLDMTWATQRRPSDVAEEVVNLVNFIESSNNVAAFLLKNYHSFLHTGVVVTGEEDRASVTSTTSKKPGDINEENPAGVIRKVYEITVKQFDLARIRDSYDCISIYNDTNDTDIHEIIVICRKEDCPPDMKTSGLHGYLGSYSYKDVTYYYWDIYEWIANTLQRMTVDGRVGFYLNLNTYISDMNTSESVKKLWKELHEKK